VEHETALPKELDVDGEIWFGVAAFAGIGVFALALALDWGGRTSRIVERNQRMVESGRVPTHSGAFAKTHEEAKRRAWFGVAVCFVGLVFTVAVGLLR
jgi:hypothetical protein